MAAESLMLKIKAIDPKATIEFSEYTHKWYVSGDLHVSDGCFLSGVTEHCDTPEAAVVAYFHRLTTVRWPDEYIVGEHHGRRREWHWNGAAFTECTRTKVLDAKAR